MKPVARTTRPLHFVTFSGRAIFSLCSNAPSSRNGSSGAGAGGGFASPQPARTRTRTARFIDWLSYDRTRNQDQDQEFIPHSPRGAPRCVPLGANGWSSGGRRQTVGDVRPV